jgi:peroxiredoxin
MTVDPAQPNVGDPAPGFTATAVGGKYGAGQVVRLEEFRGKSVVLYFYPKDDTPGCTVQACGLRDAWGELDTHANIFGVSVDSAASHEKFIKNMVAGSLAFAAMRCKSCRRPRNRWRPFSIVVFCPTAKCKCGCKPFWP